MIERETERKIKRIGKVKDHDVANDAHSSLPHPECVCVRERVCVCDRERESVCVCEREREGESQRECVRV